MVDFCKVKISFYDTAEDLQTPEQRKFCQQEKNDQTTTHDIVTEMKHGPIKHLARWYRIIPK